MLPTIVRFGKKYDRQESTLFIGHLLCLSSINDKVPHSIHTKDPLRLTANARFRSCRWNYWNISGVDFRAGINNETYKYYIDFASDQGLEYVILDEGWAVNKQTDLLQVIPEIDVQELVDYSKQQNVGIVLRADYLAMDRDLENFAAFMPTCKSTGLKWVS